MLVNLHYYRIYGTEYYYGEKEFSSPKKNPIIMENYPNKGNISKIYLGDLPRDIKEVMIADDVIGKRTISALSGNSDSEPLEQKIDKAIQSNINKNIFKSINWLITIEIIISFKIDSKYQKNNRKYLWLDVVHSDRLFSNNKNKIQEKLNSILGVITPEIGEEFFQKIIKESHFFTSQNKELSFYTFPMPQTSMSVSSSKPMSRLKTQCLIENLNILQMLENNDLKFLKNIQHWYLNTLNESDSWKVFLWSFWGLEVLSKYYSKKHYKDIFDEVEEFKNENSFSPIILQSLLPQRNQGNLNLKASFSIMTAILAKEDSIEDIALFQEVSKVRNKISHGDIVLESELPEYKTQQLFYKYYKLTIQKISKEKSI